MLKRSLLSVSASLFVTFAAASAGQPGQMQPPSAVELRTLEGMCPDGNWDKEKKIITVNISELRKKVVPQLERSGLAPDRIYLEIDGGERTVDIPAGADEASYPSLSTSRQNDVRVVFMKDGQEVHVTEARLFESLDYPKVAKEVYASYPLPSLSLPENFIRSSGMDPELVRTAAGLQRESMAWTIRPYAPAALRKTFRDTGSALKFSIDFDKDFNPSGVKIIDSADGSTVPARLDDVFVTGGAAFSWHFFDWDSEFVKRYVRFFDQKLAELMRKFKLATQDSASGAIPRELRANMTPYQRPWNVKFGRRSPNGEFFNPPLSGWSERQTTRWDPSKSNAALEETINSLRAQRGWLAASHGVNGPDGALLGFTWTNIGSGRDNAPRCLDRGGLAVDLISYYKMMLDQEREFLLTLGRWDEAAVAEKQADGVARVINDRYWNESAGLYVDLSPAEGGFYVQDPALTAAGFWPAMAYVPDGARLARMISANLENSSRFGGSYFPPSLAKDSPYYSPGGQYWRGGGWPPDFIFIGDILFENGYRGKASGLFQRVNAAAAAVSRAYRAGDSPSAALGDSSPGEQSDMKTRGTLMEFYGLKKDASGAEAPTWGRMVREDGSLHRTRTKFAGWGAAIPLEALHFVVGLDAAPAYRGPPKDLNRWLYALLTVPSLNYSRMRDIPAFRELVFEAGKDGFSPEKVSAWLSSRAGKKAAGQLALLAKGYLEISPTFDPEKTTEIKNLVYAEKRFDLKIERAAGDDEIKLTVKSAEKVPVQFNRFWKRPGKAGSVPSDTAQASSAIVEIGGDKPQATLRLSPVR